MRLIATCALGITTAALHISATALEKIVLYDGFSGADLDTKRWTELESVREIVGGKVHLRYRTTGDGTTNTGITSNFLGLTVRKPQTVRDIGATISVASYAIDKCKANAEGGGYTSLRINGSFFNVAAPTAGDQTNDVIALARVLRWANSTDPINVLTVEGLVVQCMSSDCSAQTTLDSLNLGHITLGKPIKLLIRWDAPRNRFLFRRDGGAFKAIAYRVSDTHAPGLPFKAISIRHRVENCTKQPSGATMDATIDSVIVNKSGAP